MGHPFGGHLELAAGLALGVLLLGLFTVAQTHLSARTTILAPVLVVAVLLLALNPRLEISLAAIALYLGLLDGYLKLSTGGNLATVGRDVLLYAVVAMVLIRAAIRGETMSAPPFLGNILLFVGVVLVGALNPATPGIKGALGGIKQHLEFVPLFFLAFVAIRSRARVRWLLILLVVVTMINAVVALVQLNLSPHQLASWGPGYAQRVLGTGAFAGGGRVFVAAGVTHVRPFGLGSDTAAAGELAWFGLPAALALMMVRGSRRLQFFGVLGAAAAVLAVATSQSRGAVLVTIFAVLCFGMFATTSRHLARSLGTLVVGAIVMFVVVAVLTSNVSSGIFRYGSLAPSQVGNSLVGERGGFLAITPGLAVHYPFGAGVGRVGPAQVFSGSASGLDASNEFNFLISEIGTVGLIVFIVLSVRVIARAVRVVRSKRDQESRGYAAALASGLVAVAVAWLYTLPSAATPLAPFFWTAAGIVAWASTNAVVESRVSAEEHGLEAPGSVAPLAE